MHARIRNDILQTLEFSNDQRAMCPRTGIRDVEVVSSCFRGKLAAFLDKVSELRLSAFELAAFVVGRYPVGDFAFGLGQNGVVS
jgi:hypothetical protein